MAEDFENGDPSGLRLSEELQGKFSPNGQKIFDLAKKECSRLNHPILGTEHLLWALFNIPSQPRGVSLLMYSGVKPFDVFKALTSYDFYQKRDKETNPEDLMISPSVDRVFRIALDIYHQITSEGMVAGFFVDATNIACEVLGVVCEGNLNANIVLKLFGMANPEEFIAKHDSITEYENPWETFVIGKPVHLSEFSDEGKKDQIDISLPDENDLDGKMDGPINRSNWLIPNSVLMGGVPWRKNDVKGILSAGITTFVCLIGEYSTNAYKTKQYPAEVKKLLKSKKITQKGVEFVHFPIADFEVAKAKDSVAFIQDLTRRVRSGEILYIHCLGGHGRTGLITIRLLSSLFNLATKDAQRLVQLYHDKGRKYCSSWGCYLPEDESQLEQIETHEHHDRRGGQRGIK